MLKCYKFTEYFRLTEALSLNLPPNAYTEIFVHVEKQQKTTKTCDVSGFLT